MIKKIIILLASLAIVSGSVFAVSVDAGSAGGTTVVADAADVAMLFLLESDESGSWADVDASTVTNAAWDVRAGFSTDLRVRATDGSTDAAGAFTVSVAVGNLYRDGITDGGDAAYFDAGTGVVSAASSGVGYATTSFSPTTNDEDFALTTVANYYYGLSGNEAADSLNFTLTYGGNDSAPAGTYESEVTVSYSVT